MKIIVVSGGFDPIHSGLSLILKMLESLGYINSCANSDDWLTKKRGSFHAIQ